jgi:hypothetical protein
VSAAVVLQKHIKQLVPKPSEELLGALDRLDPLKGTKDARTHAARAVFLFFARDHQANYAELHEYFKPK